MRPVSPLLLLAVAIVTVAQIIPLSRAESTVPKVTTEIINCNVVDILFVVNVEQSEAQNSEEYVGNLRRFQQRAEELINNTVAVGLLTFSSKVESVLKITNDLQQLRSRLEQLEQLPPKLNGTATGDAMTVATKLVYKHKLKLKEAGYKRRILVAVAVKRNRTVGQPTDGTAVELKQFASNVFALNMGDATSSELYSIASDGMRGIFNATDIGDVPQRFREFTEVYCPCPFSWEQRENCTELGKEEVTKFSYNRSDAVPFNCERQSVVVNETCDCPADRTARSECVNNTLTVTTITYSRENNDTDCVRQESSVSEPCGRSLGCESFICPPGSVCSEPNGSIVCTCNRTSDVFSNSGCEQCENQPPQVSRGPCLNGKREVRKVTFVKLSETQCQPNVNTSEETCELCKSNVEPVFGPCVRGYKQATRIVYNFVGPDNYCVKNLYQMRVPCKIQAGFQCIGSVSRGGQFITYDGQLIDYPGPCAYTLTKREGDFLVSVQHGIKFPTLPYLTQIDSVNIIVNGTRFELTSKFRLNTVDGAQNVPFIDTNARVEVFIVDDSLVFVSEELYVRFRPGDAVSVSVRSSANLTGMLGNCNGNATDDFTDASGRDVSLSSSRDQLVGDSYLITRCITSPCCPLPQRIPTCNFNNSVQATSLENCGLLAVSESSAFSFCGAANLDSLLAACKNLFCRAADNPQWQNKLVCSVMDTAAYRCYLKSGPGNNTYPIYRTEAFCPKSCGENAEFRNDADLCPKTCARHFFNSDVGCVTPFRSESANARGNTPIPGCQCKDNYVLDGNRCVRPNECECLSDLCIDRESKELCQSWKNDGRCQRNPLVMKKYCRLTCELCDPVCHNQISSERCEKIKSEGKCNDTFYSQMCQLTCNPESCECPPCKVVRGPCDPDTLNRNVTRYCYNVDENGVCRRNVTDEKFEECGICQTDRAAVVNRRCDYCNQTQIVTTRIRTREPDGERRCIESEQTRADRSPGCSCNGTTERTECYRGCDIYKIITTSRASADCSRCLTSTQEQKVRTVKCPTVVKKGECDREVTKRRQVTIIRGLVKNCACENITMDFEEYCECPPPRWTPSICYLNKKWIRWHISYHLHEGTCLVKSKRHVTSVPCPKRKNAKEVCEGRQKFKIISYYFRRNCVCSHVTRKVRIGDCSCPPPRKVVSDCINDEKEITFIKFILEKSHCTKIQHSIRVPCSCPPTQQINRCDGNTGVRTVGKREFRLVRDTCQQVENTRDIATVCPPSRVLSRGECQQLSPEDKVKYQEVTYVVGTRVEGQCSCRQITQKKTEPCGCKLSQVEETKCPSDCPEVSNTCPSHCHRQRIHYRLRYFEGQCKREQASHEVFPCCCQKPKPLAPRCVSGHLLVKYKQTVELKNDTCKRSILRKVIDLTSKCDLGKVLHHRRGDQLILKRKKLEKCRCVWRQTSKYCPSSCGSKKDFNRCDPASNEKIHISVWGYRVGCHCKSKRRVTRQRTICPEASTKVVDHCASKGYKAIEIEKYTADNCRCVRSAVVKKLRCFERSCDSSPRESNQCDPTGHQMFKLVEFQIPYSGRCVQRLKRSRIKMPKCKVGVSRYIRCIGGDMVLYKKQTYMHYCKCRSKVDKRILGTCDDYCAQRNKEYGSEASEKRKCNPNTNTITIYRLRWEPKHGGGCARHWRPVATRAEPDCPPPDKRIEKCDPITGKQRIITRTYTMRQCKCVGPAERVSYRSCVCKGRKVLKNYCDTKHGSRISVVLLQSWNGDLQACHAKKLYHRVPIRCHYRSKESHGKCHNGKIRYVRDIYWRDLQSCTCKHKRKVVFVDCRCKIHYQRQVCKPGEDLAKTVIVYRKFDDKLKKCVPYRTKRIYRRCRCPKPTENKACVQGRWEITRVSFKLEGKVCVRSQSTESYAVACPKKLITEVKDCNRNCLKEQLVFRYQVNPGTCKCERKQLATRSCKCCNCPDSKTDETCEQDRFLKTTITYYSIRTNVCSDSCKRRTRVVTKRIKCSKKRAFGWGPCEKCLSRKYKEYQTSVSCKCQKRRAWLDEYRACCCKPNTRMKKKCQTSSGRFQTITYKTVLRGHKCKRITTMDHDPLPTCTIPDNPITYGECNNSTCKQAVIRTFSKLNKNICACQLKQKQVGERECCCLNTEPTRDTRCQNNDQLVSVVTTPVFNEEKFICETRQTSSVVPVICNSTDPRVDIPPCTGQTRTIVTRRLVVQNCECVEQEVARRTEACQCPNATQWVDFACDRGNRILRRTTYTLVNGECESSIEEIRRPVICPNEPKIETECNRSTCIGTEATTRYELDEEACLCKRSVSSTVGACCCPSDRSSRIECIDNKFVEITSQKQLDRATRTCKTVETQNRASDPQPCEEQTVRDLGCDPSTRMRVKQITKRSLVNCRCQVINRSSTRELCACPPPKVTRGQCSHKTCQRAITTIQFTAVNSTNGTLSCVESKSVEYQICCCTKVGEKKVHVTKECDPQTGDILYRKYWKIFLPKIMKCKTVYKTKVRPLRCGPDYDSSDRDIRYGRCDMNTGLQSVHTVWYEADRRQCKCTRQERTTSRTCSCKHLKLKEREYCDKEKNEIVKEIKHYVLKSGKCVKKLYRKRRQVSCPLQREVRKSCGSDCKLRTEISFNKLRNCQCKRNQVIKTKLCCCPETQFKKECLNDRWRMVTIRFKLSSDQRACNKDENTRIASIKCSKDEKIKKGQCNKETCLQKLTKLQYRPQKCKCAAVPVASKTIRCCCPKPKIEKKCGYDGKALVLKKTIYKLRYGKCVSKSTKKIGKIRCNHPKLIRKEHCNPESNTRKYIFFYYNLDRCRCKKRIVAHTQACHCPPPKIIRSICSARQRYHAVYKITYRAQSGYNHQLASFDDLEYDEFNDYGPREPAQCKIKKKLLFKEPCHCPPPKQRRMCDPQGGRQWKYLSLTYKLISKGGRKTCERSHKVQMKPIRCNEPSLKRGKCIGGVRNVMQTRWYVRNCQCVSRVRAYRQKCYQPPKPQPSKRCLPEEGAVATYARVIDPMTGEIRIQRKFRYIRCNEEMQVIPLAGGCQIYRNGGIYRKVAIVSEYRAGCRCKRRRKLKLKLCGCQKPRVSHKCLADSMDQSYRTSYSLEHGTCVPERRRYSRMTSCRGPSVEIRKGECDEHTCLRKVYVFRNSFHNCRCKRQRKIGTERCCAPEPVINVKCKGGYRYTFTTTYTLERVSVLAQDINSGVSWNRVKLQHRRRKTRKRIRCPETKVQQHCDRETGVLTKRVTIYRPVGCHCKPRMKTYRNRCRCPAPRKVHGKCVGGWRRCKKIYYSLDEEGHCTKKYASFKKRCACPKNRSFARCHHGKKQLCYVSYSLDDECKPKRQCRYREIKCRAPRVVNKKCDTKTGRRLVLTIRFAVNKRKCECVQEVERKYIACACSRLDRMQRKCEGNVLTIITKNYHLQDDTCVPAVSMKRKKIVCRKQRVELVPSTCVTVRDVPLSGTQEAKIITYKPVGCKCKRFVKKVRVPCRCELIEKFRTREKRVCDSDNTLRTISTRFELVGLHCKPVQDKLSSSIDCDGEVTTRDGGCVQDPIGDKFKTVSMFRAMPRSCKCVPVKISSTRVNCGCRPPKIRHRCVDDKIKETCITRYTPPEDEAANCIAKTETQMRPIQCNETITKITPCSNVTQFQKVITISYEPKDCKCVKKFNVQKQRCLCPESRAGQEVCNPDTNRFEQKIVSFELRDGQCVQNSSTVTRTVRCDNRAPANTTGPCQNGRRTVTTNTFQLSNCQCVINSRSSNELCDCNGVRRELGVCNGTQRVTYDLFYREVFNSTSGECQEQLERRQVRYCQCDLPRSTTVCVNNNVLRRITIISTLVNNTCQESTRFDDKIIDCPGNVASRTTRSPCNPVTFTRTVTTTVPIVENCNCTNQMTRSTENCNCFEKNGGRQESTTCKNDTTSVTTISYFYESSPGICTERNFTQENRVTCNGRKEERDVCKKDSGEIEIRIFELRAKSCGCVWEQLPSRFEACRCRAPKTHRICLASKGRWLLITKYWVVKQGKCVQKKQKLFKQVKCRSRVKVHHSECNRFTNKRKEVKIVYERVGCGCQERKIKKRCPCKCPGSQRWSVCRKNKIVTYSIAYRLRGCHCVKQSLCSHKKPVCARRTVTKSTCLPGPNGDSFLTRVCSKKIPIGCKCKTVKQETTIACACVPREQRQQRCLGSVIETTVTRRQLIGGVCRRVHVQTKRETIKCPLSKLTTVSQCGKEKYRRMRHVVWHKLKCKCVPVVSYKRQACSKRCDLPLKLKKIGKCKKPSCTRRKYYVYKDAYCKPKYSSQTESCCCHRPSNMKRRCMGNAFEVTQKFSKLRNGVCVLSSITYRKEIECNRRLRYTKALASDGKKVAVKTWFALKHCECKEMSMRLLTKEKECRAPLVRNQCINAPEQRIMKTVTRFVKVKGRCERQDTVTETPIECSPTVVSRSGCTLSKERNAWVRLIKRVAFRKQNCKCIGNKLEEFEVCRCRQPTVKTNCLRGGMIEVIRTGYQPIADGSSCEPVISKKLVRVNCDSTWRPAPSYKRMSTYSYDLYYGYMVMQREVRDACRCKIERKKRPCHSRCPKSTKRSMCVDGNKLFNVVSNYYKAGSCTCCVKVKHRQVQVRLPQARTLLGDCNKSTCDQVVTSINYIIDDCKPKEVRSQTTRKCCCKAPETRFACRLNNLRVKLTKTEILTKSGTCAQRTISDTQVVTCRRLIREQAIGQCANGLRAYRREFENPVNCKCKMATEIVKRPCAFRACDKPRIDIGKCINCKQLVRELQFTYNVDKQKCVSHKHETRRNCCCPAPKVTKRCLHNKLVLVSESYLFHSQSNRCVPSSKKIDITGKLWKKCKLQEKTMVGGCMPSGLRIVSTVRVTVVNCRCIPTRSFRFEHCRCDPPVRTNDCVRNGTTLYSKNITNTLDGNACKRRVDESFTPIECPLDSYTEGVCDETNCLRRVVMVNYTVSDCACQRKISDRMEVCCCPPATNETRTCRRSDNTEVITTRSQEFDMQTRACVERTSTTTNPIICEPNRRQIRSPCNIQRNNSFYQIVTDSETVASGCECERRQQQSEVLCGCAKTEPETVCTEDNRLQTFQIVYKLNENFTECIPNRVVLSERDVVCDGTVRSTVPQCTTGTRSSSGVTRVNVVRSWLVRGPSCTCTRRVRIEPRICRCPDSPAPRIFCRKGTNERVEITYRYTLVNSTDEPECVKTKVERSLGAVTCPEPVVNLTSCHFGLLQARTTVFHLKNCHCLQKSYKTFQRCSKKHPLCINKLPDKLCVYLDNAYGLCRKDFANSSNDVRHADKLCDKQCRKCDSCAAIGGKWKFQFSGSNCLVSDIKYQMFFIEEAKNFDHCLYKCKSNPLCESFDFYLPSKSCVLARVNRERLTELLHPSRHTFGTGPAELKLRDAESCGLYERYCSRRVQNHLEQVQLGCPRSHIKNETSPCTCSFVSLAQGQYKLCYKTVTIEYYTRAKDGKCQNQTAFIRTVCKEQSKCKDDLDVGKCREIERNGGCSVTETARLCKRTCNLCQCNGREFVSHSACHPDNGIQKVTVFATEWMPAFGLCKLRISHSVEPCTSCEVGQRTYVSPCKDGQRLIVKVKRKLVDGECKRSVHKRSVKCSGCYIGVHRALGACSNGYRYVKIFYTQLVHDACRELQLTDRIPCSGCPQPKYSSGTCVGGKRQQRVTYYVRWPHSNRCYAAHYVNELRCKPLCYNKLSAIECKYIQMTGQCIWNRVAQQFCRRACNMC